ncbi:trace amine-associated receptor 13c-like [Denticeps clupeoides]|uniref:G-protein coupled receptors family 1 profile domain-containing protein n=1 Tax=Denticeps clupeoides TaxID=299321 RepID=A0AAY4B8D6_9TELE|nr:trace amine-associated receptor 13c-like [Denticeps clupeoides]
MDMKEYNLIIYLFQFLNYSCTTEANISLKHITMYCLFSSLSMLTVFLNLLVIISISHFKQLQTPTNMLIHSLAVADLLVGAVVIPFEAVKLIDVCWDVGKNFCVVFQLIVYSIILSSLGHLVLIAIDRYIAVCEPMLYHQKVTVGKTVLCICIVWTGAASYNIILICYNNQGQFSNGQCVSDITLECGVFDLIVTFIVPCSVIISLYLKIFKVATGQVRAIKSGFAVATMGTYNRRVGKTSQYKAANTLSIVVVVYLLCWIPYYICLLVNRNGESNAVTFFTWILYCNSSVNPLIYALFYGWFKKSARHILTLNIFKQSSSYYNLMSDKS